MNKEYLQTLSPKQERRLLNMFPSLDVVETALVPNDVNMIIDDVGLSNQEKSAIASFIDRRVLFFEPQELTTPLQDKLDGKENDGTFLVFPKNGGLQVEKRLETTNVTSGTFSIRRDPGDIIYGRIAGLNESTLEKIMDIKPDNIEVVDDVVVTGSTVREIKRFIESNVGRTFFWSLSVWLMSYPKKYISSPSGIYGVRSTTAAVVYTRESGGNAPLNSISTWMFDDEKGEIVLENYASKYANDNKNKFISYINKLKDKK